MNKPLKSASGQSGYEAYVDILTSQILSEMHKQVILKSWPNPSTRKRQKNGRFMRSTKNKGETNALPNM